LRGWVPAPGVGAASGHQAVPRLQVERERQNAQVGTIGRSLETLGIADNGSCSLGPQPCSSQAEYAAKKERNFAVDRRVLADTHAYGIVERGIRGLESRSRAAQVGHVSEYDVAVRTVEGIGVNLRSVPRNDVVARVVAGGGTGAIGSGSDRLTFG